MSIQRLLLSLAWRLFPYGKTQIKTINKVRLPLRARGDFASLEEIFIQQAYAPLMAAIPWPVRTWVDLGCNAGMFSAWLYDQACTTGHGKDCKALLIDAGSCIRTAREFVSLNHLTHFTVIQTCIGDGQPTNFYESKSSIRSSSAIKPDSREKIVPCQTKSLTSLLESNQWPSADLVKIDIEGAEKYLLSETGLLQRFRAGIIEWHSETTDGPTVSKWITDQGGKIVKIIDQKETGGDPILSNLGMLVWIRD